MSGILCSNISYIFSSNLVFYSQDTICNIYKEVDFYAGRIKGTDFPDMCGSEALAIFLENEFLILAQGRMECGRRLSWCRVTFLGFQRTLPLKPVLKEGGCWGFNTARERASVVQHSGQMKAT